MSLRAELLLAATGVFRDSPVTRDDARAGEGILLSLRRRVNTWMRSKSGDADDFVSPGKRSVDGTLEKLSQPISEGDAETLMAEFTDLTLGGEYVQALRTAREFLLNARVAFYLESATGPIELPMSEDDEEEWFSLIAVIDDPIRLVEEMEMQTLTSSQAGAFRAVFPALTDFVYQTVFAAIQGLQERKRELLWEKDNVLRILEDLPPEAPIVAGTNPTAQVQPPKAPKVDIQSGLAKEQTQAQRSANPNR